MSAMSSPCKPIAVDVRALAALTSLSPRKIAGLVAENRIPTILIDGRRLYIVEDVLEWLRSQSTRIHQKGGDA